MRIWGRSMEYWLRRTFAFIGFAVVVVVAVEGIYLLIKFFSTF